MVDKPVEVCLPLETLATAEGYSKHLCLHKQNYTTVQPRGMEQTTHMASACEMHHMGTKSGAAQAAQEGTVWKGVLSYMKTPFK